MDISLQNFGKFASNNFRLKYDLYLNIKECQNECHAFYGICP
jgi:hypothetical protein